MKIFPPDCKVQDLSSGPPHVTGHFDQLLLQWVFVLGQLVEAQGPVPPFCVQLGLHCLLEDYANVSASWTPNSCVSFKPPKPPNWYTNITFQVIQKRTSGLAHISTSLLTISLSFGMFTAGWQYVANECRVATMEEGERERDAESWGEGGGEWVAFMVHHTHWTGLLGWGLLECYVSEGSLERS